MNACDQAGDDWERLAARCTWLVAAGTEVVVGRGRPARTVSLPGLPRASLLLSTATVTPVRLDGEVFELLAWGSADARRGWLCRPPVVDDVPDVHPVHRLLWTVTGGIEEHFGPTPDTWWWLNCNDVLTRRALDVPVEAMMGVYGSIWAEDGYEIPIDAAHYAVVAVEANGNLTLAHQRSGQVVWFARDHAESGVTALPGWPEYTWYTFDGAPDLASWIETGVAQWVG